MERTYLRGDLYYADLGRGIGCEQTGYRPVVIVQNDVGNKYSNTVIAAPVSTKRRRGLPTHLYISTESGLYRPSVVLLEQLRTIDKKRLGQRIGRLPERQMKGLDKALAISVGLCMEGERWNE